MPSFSRSFGLVPGAARFVSAPFLKYPLFWVKVSPPEAFCPLGTGCVKLKGNSAFFETVNSQPLHHATRSASGMERKAFVIGHVSGLGKTRRALLESIR